MQHCHHYYDENEKAAVLQHDHPCETVAHITPELEGLPIYWDHEGYDCDKGGEG